VLVSSPRMVFSCSMPTKGSHFGFSAKRLCSGRSPSSRPICYDGDGGHRGMLPLSLALGRGITNASTLAIAVIGGILISMILSLIITPAIQYYMTREA